MKRFFLSVFVVAAVVGTTWTPGFSLEDYSVDDGSAELYTGSPAGVVVVANRFVPGRSVVIGSISFFTSGVASGDGAEVILYEDPSGSASTPDGSMEVWRTSIVLGDGDWQEESTGGVLVNGAGSADAAFFVAVANNGTMSFSLGIDQTPPVQDASFMSADGGVTFQPLSAWPILDGNAMIRAHEGEIVCWDNDGDGFDDEACGGDDCNDSEADTYPGAVELCDGADNDCDGVVPVDEADDDGDGWMVCEGDCDDSASQVNPAAAEACENGIDDDCDGFADGDDPDCAPIFAATVTCIDTVVAPGGIARVRVEIDNLTDEVQHFQGSLNILRCSGELYKEHRQGDATIAPGGHFQAVLGVTIPAAVPSGWKNCDIGFELVVSDFDTGAFQDDAVCYWQIQDPS